MGNWWKDNNYFINVFHVFISAVDLSNVLTPDSLMPMLADPEFRDQLAPFLPAGDELPQDPTELANTLRSPQFQQVTTEA